jgi:LPXTG-motif cell wall-anchored protein
VVVQLKQAPVLAIQPTGEEVELAQVVAAPPADEPLAQATLPATSSTMPLIALLGLLALGGAFALRFAQKRLQ